MSRILLLSDNRRLRGQLAGYLRPVHDVLVDETDDLETGPFDLGILDTSALARVEPQVRARRLAEAPSLLPFLLATSPSELSRTSQLGSESIDEVILTPCRETELLARTESLLRTRRMAAEIAALRQNVRELEEHVGRILLQHDAERQQVARDLHDTTAQDLAALAMNLSLVEQSAPPGDFHLARLLVDCQQLTDKSAKRIRALSYMLHPPLVDELGLARAITVLAGNFSEQTGINVHLDLPEEMERLPHPIEMVLLRALQQGLANVRQHSGSPAAHIRLARDNATVWLEVRDEGRGMPPGWDRPDAMAGMGLWEVRHRLHHSGGRLEIEPSLPGVRLRAILPLQPRASHETSSNPDRR